MEQGRAFLNEEVEFAVTSVLQTNAGRMIFGRLGDGSAAAQNVVGGGRRPRPRSDTQTPA